MGQDVLYKIILEEMKTEKKEEEKYILVADLGFSLEIFSVSV